jgi:uncharacterized membrane protein
VTATRASRLSSLDCLRGVVMVLMAIDHVRVYAGVPAGGRDAAVFFTRWVTHFCAPVFVFLAGTGAFLQIQSLVSQMVDRAEARARVARFLLIRGMLLVALELTVIKFSWTFALDYSPFVLAGVIWMLGWSMVLLGVLLRLSASPAVLGFTGVAIVLLQPLFGLAGTALPSSVRSIWEFIYPVGGQALFGMEVLYVLVPWIGVMLAGYGFGAIVTKAPADRDRWCLRIGLGATVVYLAIATAMVLSLTLPPAAPPRWMLVLAQQKYPASALFLMMTLGPSIALLPFFDRLRGRIGGVFVTFGRVPMFYYLLHIPAIHVAALATAWIRGDGIHQEWYATAPYATVPEAARWSLAELYLVFATVVAALYLPCRWFAAVRARRPATWLRLV